jgi:hypothetical protein
METPEKIWVHELSAMELNVPMKEYGIEYTRTDVFIEKAAEWLNKELYTRFSGKEHFVASNRGINLQEFIKKFENHMKGE